LGITVILAHVERYSKDKLYKDIIKLIKTGVVSAQINAESILSPITQKDTLKLIKGGLVSYIASDAHSTSQRPVLLNKAFMSLKDKYYPQLTRCKKLSNHLEERLEGI
jgi:tyrosine-protein phosphatase YwqE